ncbi:prepilin-type N-terminal cleavage/methylation domain-containing protein [Alkalimonas amylolytica]|uniref:Prepilin-type N-terminal cleavage/methylation domain-containing protein n=1 Tax=Alkalimonas amylolytica TaxID=152573 RepID=A0A1H4A163_ALKAM|nr:prepilin-type N-terminal cleavage/methylation domain-containing protein [Alkalimonas amylolytica]SEA29647.1 prepilin-type N-terminal cleavage/methylation domain-containing protein [Alkalimonas amylolytica]
MDRVNPHPCSPTRCRANCATRAIRAQRGFTLIEVLLAITLLSLLMLSAVMAYDFMQQNWQRNQASQQRSQQHHAQWQLLYDVLVNTFPKLVQQQSLQSQRGDSGAVGFYFLGRENGFTAVSATSMQDPASAAVYRLFKEPDPAQPGLWQLVYEEALLKEQLLAYAEQELPFAFRRVLLTGQQQLEFAYRGYASLQQKLQAQDDPATSLSWQSEYDGIQALLQPEQLHISSDSWQWQQRFDHSGNEQLSQLDGGL